MNLLLEKTETVTPGGKCRCGIRSEAGKSLGWLQMCLPRIAWEKVWTIWWMAARKMEVFLVVSGFDATEVRKPCLSTWMLISNKVTWEEEMVGVNRTG